MKEKKNPTALDREQLFGGGFFTQTSVYVEDSRGLTLPALFQVTKGNKISAKTAISRNLKAFALITRTASVYRL